MSGLVVLAGLAMLALITPRYGADSRGGRDWWYQRPHVDRLAPCPRHSLRSDLRKLFGRARRRIGWMWAGQELAWALCLRAHQPWLRGGRREELHWLEVNGTWRLAGRWLPPAPPSEKHSSESSAR